MKTYEIDKLQNSIRSLQTLPWLNQPVICGNLIYEVNFTGVLTYRLVDHYISGFSYKFEICDKLFGQKTIFVGNRILVQERYQKIRIYNQPNQNCILPPIFEQVNYKLFAYKILPENKVVILDSNLQLLTLNAITGKVIRGFQVTQKLLSPNCKVSDQIRYYTQNHRVVMQDNTFYGEDLILPKDTDLKLFKLIEIVNDHQIQVLLYFLFPQFKMSLRLSENLEYMIDMQTMEMFKREEYPFENNIYIWTQIAGQTSDSNNWKYNLNNSIISPDLQLYLDYEARRKQHIIKRTIDGGIYMEIPSEIIDSSKLNQLLYFKWVSNHEISFTHDSGVEKVLDIHKNFAEVSFKVFNLQSHYGQNKQIEQNYYINLMPFQLDEVHKKLQTNQNQFLIRQQNYRDKDVKKIFRECMIEFQYSWIDHYMKYIPMIEYSFTHYHWLLSENIQQDHILKTVNQISIEDLQILLLQVFPDGNTFLHNIANINDVLEAVSQRIKKDFVFLFMKNAQGQTPLHLSLTLKNYFAVDIFLKLLSNHPFYTHSFVIVDILPKLISTELPSLKLYFDSRLIQTQILQQYKRGSLKCKKSQNHDIQITNLWESKSSFSSSCFKKDIQECDIKVYFIDFPRLNIQSDSSSQDLFLALSNSQSLDIFEVKTIQYLIEYQWAMTK